MTLPAEHAKIVEEIVSMGYPKEEVIRACKAAFFNADRAVEYLCTGIPAGMNLNQGAGFPLSIAIFLFLVEEQGEADEGDAIEGELLEGLGFLSNSPQFQQLREMVVFHFLMIFYFDLGSFQSNSIATNCPTNRGAKSATYGIDPKQSGLLSCR